MKGTLLKHIIVFTLVIVSGGLLMNVSHDVQRTEREIKRIDRKIDREEESIRVLRAEWAYLNNPVRLEILAAGHVNLISPEAAQLISDMSVIPDNDPQAMIFIPRRSPLHRDISYGASSSLSIQANDFPKNEKNTNMPTYKDRGAR